MTIRSENSLAERLAKYPTPLHLYYRDRLLADSQALARGLKSNLPSAKLFYSTKTNSLLSMLQTMLSEGWLMEAVCGSDMKCALLAGAKGSDLLMAGAAWSKTFVEAALYESGVSRVTLDSPSMARLVGECLKASPVSVDVALRIHDGNSHFGLPLSKDALESALQCIPQNCVRSLGLHFHRNPSGSADGAESIAKDFRERTKIALEAARMLSPKKISFLNLGGGIDSPWIYRFRPEDLGEFHDPIRCGKLRESFSYPRFSLEDAAARISSAVAEELQSAGAVGVEIFFEPGRAACTRALSTAIEVRAVKGGFYPGKEVILTDGNTAILGPLHRALHPVLTERSTEKEARCFVYGNLPHSGDWLFQDLSLPKPSEGDRLLIEHTGAYFLPLEANFGLPRPGIYDARTGDVLRTPENDLDPGLRDMI